MTSADILTLPAGPELDGLIDEHVWGIDRRATTPKQRQRAIVEAEGDELTNPNFGPSWVQEITLCGKLWIVEREDHPERFIESAPDNYCREDRWIWRERVGKPWQTDLEAHVSAWRAPPTKPWSTDIASAWEIVEKILMKSAGHFVSYSPQKTKAHRWNCMFSGKGWHVDLGGETATLAICRAALLATNPPPPDTAR